MSTRNNLNHLGNSELGTDSQGFMQQDYTAALTTDDRYFEAILVMVHNLFTVTDMLERALGGLIGPGVKPDGATSFYDTGPIGTTSRQQGFTFTYGGDKLTANYASAFITAKANDIHVALRSNSPTEMMRVFRSGNVNGGKITDFTTLPHHSTMKDAYRFQYNPTIHTDKLKNNSFLPNRYGEYVLSLSEALNFTLFRLNPVLSVGQTIGLPLMYKGKYMLFGDSRRDSVGSFPGESFHSFIGVGELTNGINGQSHYLFTENRHAYGDSNRYLGSRSTDGRSWEQFFVQGLTVNNETLKSSFLDSNHYKTLPDGYQLSLGRENVRIRSRLLSSPPGDVYQYQESISSILKSGYDPHDYTTLNVNQVDRRRNLPFAGESILSNDGRRALMGMHRIKELEDLVKTSAEDFVHLLIYDYLYYGPVPEIAQSLCLPVDANLLYVDFAKRRSKSVLDMLTENHLRTGVSPGTPLSEEAVRDMVEKFFVMYIKSITRGPDDNRISDLATLSKFDERGWTALKRHYYAVP